MKNSRAVRRAIGISVVALSMAGVSRAAEPFAQARILEFIRDVVVAPDAAFLTGGFARVNYVPGTDRLVVTFQAQLAQPSGGCPDAGYAYKEYTEDMQATGKTGILSCDPADAGSTMVDNTYYFAAMHRQEQSVGWHMVEFDAVTWHKLRDMFFPVGYPQEGEGDPMVAYVNGMLDVSSQFNDNASGTPPGWMEGAATHHQFFSADLVFLGKKHLSDTPHIVGSSLIFVDDIYYFVSANAYLGDLVVMTYDKNWTYLGVKTLVRQAHWSTGLVYDGQRFYVAYADTSQRATPTNIPVWENIHLAAFDREWNLLEDVAVTHFTQADNRQTGRPWVILHDHRLYVSYDVDTRDPVTYAEQGKSSAMVSIYQLRDGPSRHRAVGHGH